MSYKQVITDLGRDVIARGQTGLVVTFTRVVLGEGEIEDSAVIPTMTGMIEPVMDTNIVAIARTGIGQITITAKVPLASIPRDFHLHEIGVFARIDDEPEVLYGYSYTPDPARHDIISQEMAGGSKSEHTIQIAVVVGSSEQVTAVLATDFEIINIGTSAQGIGWYKDRIGNTFRFKRFAGGGDVDIVEEEDDIRLTVQGVPSGATVPYFGEANAVPTGWLLCDGRWYSKTEHPRLASLLGNRFGGDANNFATPNLQDRYLMGASVTRPFGSTGGEASHVLTEQEMPAHNHPIYDPGHNHALWDGGHNHGHSDPGHSHYVNDPTHRHICFFSTNADTGTPRPGIDSTPPYGYVSGGRDYGVVYGSGHIWLGDVWSSSVGTGIWLTGAGTGMQNVASLTGIQVQTHYPTAFGMSIQNRGGNAAHNNLPPYMAINYIIRE